MIDQITKKNFDIYVNIILVIPFVLGIAFLYGYWSTLDVNIFPFLSLSDLIRFAAYPILIFYVPLFMLYWLVTELNIRIIDEDKLQTLAKRLNKHRAWYVKHSPILLIIAYFIAAITLGSYLHITALQIGIPVTSLIYISWLRNIIKNNKLDDAQQLFHRYGRSLFLLCLLPFFSYDIGHHKAESILKGKEFSYMVFDLDGKHSIYKFLGYVNGHYFFLERNNKVLRIENNIDKLKLIHFLQTGQDDTPEIGFT